jgi:hypothetical protein
MLKWNIRELIIIEITFSCDNLLEIKIVQASGASFGKPERIAKAEGHAKASHKYTKKKSGH